MKSRHIPAIVAGAALIGLTGLPLMSGCEEEEHEYPRHRVVEEYVAPGYYYDPDYYDEYHAYHPRVYYYYDGYRWERRDQIPHDVRARQRSREFRAQEHRDHEEHEEHERHDEHEH